MNEINNTLPTASPWTTLVELTLPAQADDYDRGVRQAAGDILAAVDALHLHPLHRERLQTAVYQSGVRALEKSLAQPAPWPVIVRALASPELNAAAGWGFFLVEHLTFQSLEAALQPGQVCAVVELFLYREGETHWRDI